MEEKRVAFVIGNAQYQKLEALRNPKRASNLPHPNGNVHCSYRGSHVPSGPNSYTR
jgi:hypothetical protein